MTCSRESAKRFGADRFGAALVSMRDAVVRNRTLYFAARLMGADGPRDCVCSGKPIEAHADDRGIMGVPIAAGRGGKLGRWRHPRRPLEDVLQRAPLLDIDGEVCLRQIQQKAGGRFLQGVTNACERVGGRRLLGVRHSGERNQHARQLERNRTHLISTIPVPVWPVEDSR